MCQKLLEHARTVAFCSQCTSSWRCWQCTWWIATNPSGLRAQLWSSTGRPHCHPMGPRVTMRKGIKWNWKGNQKVSLFKQHYATFFLRSKSPKKVCPKQSVFSRLKSNVYRLNLLEVWSLISLGFFLPKCPDVSSSSIVSVNWPSRLPIGGGWHPRMVSSQVSRIVGPDLVATYFRALATKHDMQPRFKPSLYGSMVTWHTRNPCILASNLEDVDGAPNPDVLGLFEARTKPPAVEGWAIAWISRPLYILNLWGLLPND